MIKLFLYRFLGKFIKYYKRKYIDMSIVQMQIQIENLLKDLGLTDITHGIKKSNKLKFIFVAKSTISHYNLRIDITFENNNMSVRYRTFLYDNFYIEGDEFQVLDNLHTEKKDINMNLENIKGSLIYKYSMLE